MKEILTYLKECGTFYLATEENGQPRVRPFGAVTDYENKLYLITSNQKPVYDQLVKNPKIEISGMNKGTWVRLEAEVVFDTRREVKEKMLEEYSMLSKMYSADDEIMTMLYLKDATATIYSYSDAPVSYTF